MSAPPFAQAPTPTLLRVVPVLFFLSGASSLTFETLFSRLLTYTFGNTAHAVSTVLAAFLGGLALGAFLIGRWADRRPPSLWIYGLLELSAALWCFFTPWLLGTLTHVYVFACQRWDLSPTAVGAVRFGLSALAIVVPATLMGGTLPVLAKLVASLRPGEQPLVDRLYAINTFGAATGTLLSSYLLMPQLGVRGTLWTACGVNAVIFLGVAALARRHAPAAATSAPAPEVTPAAIGASASMLLAGAFATGAVSLAYEVIWTHVLAFLVGNSVYAFGAMLFTFLCGLGLGAHFVARRLGNPRRWVAALAISQLLLGLAVYLTLPLWGRVPDLFAKGIPSAAAFDFFCLQVLLCGRALYVAIRTVRRRARGRREWGSIAEVAGECLGVVLLARLHGPALFNIEASNFVVTESFRFCCSFLLLIVPSLLLGMSFPLLLNVASSAGGKVASRVGGVYSMNTLGTVVGSVATGFFLLPALGSLTSLRCAATASLAVGVGFGLFNRAIARPGKVVVVLAAVGIGALVWFGPGEWDPRHITGDSYVYFKPARVNDRILYLGEDVQGGMTAVVQTGPTRQLLSNGKFEGNNSGEVGAQIRFALVPALFTSHFDRALVIGLGTGNTLRTVSQFPFKAIDAIELAPHIVEAARLFFENENQLVFDRDPRVHLTVADGRNHLLLTRQTYDLITIEITSIWISGEADLYNREFYELCRARLGREGVLQQWVQIHHMRPTDLLVLLNTAAQVFPHAAFFLGPEQGLLIASAAPLTVDYQRIAALDADPGVRHELDAIHAPSMFSLLGEMVLYEGSFARAAGSLPQRGLPRDFASSDLEPYLEYATPKGNTLPYDTRPLNTELLESFRGPWPLPSNLPSASEGELVLGYLTEAVGEPEQAVAHWERVEGPSRERAQAEIARVRAAKP